MWIFTVLGCGVGPVPPHPEGLEPVRTVLLSRDFDGLARAAMPFTQAQGGDPNWEAVRGAARSLARADVPSKATAAYGALVVACAGCHHDPVEIPLEKGHGAAFLALEQGVIRRDADARKAAAAEVPRHADLGASRLRLDQLSLKIATPASRERQALHYAEAMQECLRCHGLRPGL